MLCLTFLQVTIDNLKSKKTFRNLFSLCGPRPSPQCSVRSNILSQLKAQLRHWKCVFLLQREVCLCPLELQRTFCLPVSRSKRLRVDIICSTYMVQKPHMPEPLTRSYLTLSLLMASGWGHKNQSPSLLLITLPFSFCSLFFYNLGIIWYRSELCMHKK